MSEQGDDKLNSGGRLARAFLHTKITPLIMLAITLFGLMAIIVTPRLYNPEIVVPAAEVIVARPGNGPEQIQRQVVQPLQQLMSSLRGVKHVYGYAGNDVGMVTVQFEVGANETTSLMYLYNELQRNIDRLPPGSRPPLVKSIGINDVPIMAITLSSSQLGGTQLREVAEHFLAALHTVPDVGISQVIGAEPKAVKILIDPQRLASSGVSLNQLLKVLKGSNVIVPGGKLEQQNREIPLRVSATFGSVRDLGSIIIGAKGKRPIYLKDVAQIVQGPRNHDQHAWVAFGRGAGAQAFAPENAVTITIGKRAGTNAVTVAHAVQSKLKLLEREALPAGVHVTLTRNYGHRANEAVNTLIEHLAVAVGVVLVILFFFLGWREAVIVTLLVPLTLFVVLGVGMTMGHTINRITLFALILSLGLLVDAGIVVIENIHRHLHQVRSVRDFSQLLIQATNEIGNPTNIATLAVILAFIPMLFVTGMMGPFMRPIPINVPIAMIASLILAYIVVPYIARLWLRSKAALHEGQQRPSLEEEDSAPQDPLRKLYLRVFTPLQANRRMRNIFFVVVGLLLLASLLMPAWQFIRPSGMNGPESLFGVNLKMLPEGNVSTFTLQIQTPAGTALPATNRIALAVAQKVASNRYVTNVDAYLGRTGPLSFAGMVRGDEIMRGGNIAQLVVNLVPKGERPHTALISEQIWKTLKPLRTEFADTHIMLFLVPPGPPTRAQVVARIYGPDYSTLRKIAASVSQDFRQVYGMINVHDSVTTTRPEYQIRVDPHKAMVSGVAPGQVAQLVHNLVAGTGIGSVFRPSVEPEDIVVKLAQPDRAWIQQVENLTITSQQGKQVPLSSIVDIRQVDAAKPIFSVDGNHVVYVMGDSLGYSPEFAALVLNHKLDGKTLPSGVTLTTGNLGFTSAQPDGISKYQVFWGGDMRLTLDVFRDLGAAFIVALVFIYLLLVAYYQSFVLPLIVMGAIPLTLVGIFPGHWAFAVPFNATSMIGFIALAGIVVRNSLLLIDFILDYRRQGYSIEEAVREAGAVRFRPILLTALAIMFGSAVMISDPVFGGLAVALISGTFASTILTLIVIPLLYMLWQQWVARRQYS
ncbi:MAG: efflux RND transporter permease subunit [Gammaproteobacteria bacterium]